MTTPAACAVCAVCAAPISKRARTCSPACRQSLYRERHSARYRAAMEVVVRAASLAPVAGPASIASLALYAAETLADGDAHRAA